MANWEDVGGGRARGGAGGGALRGAGGGAPGRRCGRGAWVQPRAMWPELKHRLQVTGSRQSTTRCRGLRQWKQRPFIHAGGGARGVKAATGAGGGRGRPRLTSVQGAVASSSSPAAAAPRGSDCSAAACAGTGRKHASHPELSPPLTPSMLVRLAERPGAGELKVVVGSARARSSGGVSKTQSTSESTPGGRPGGGGGGEPQAGSGSESRAAGNGERCGPKKPQGSGWDGRARQAR